LIGDVSIPQDFNPDLLPLDDEDSDGAASPIDTEPAETTRHAETDAAALDRDTDGLASFRL
jgi:hypothetical protein